MLTVTNLHVKRGWTGHDHLISDAALDVMLGQSYRRVSDIQRRVNAIQRREFDWRVQGAPVAVEIKLPTGDYREIMA